MTVSELIEYLEQGREIEFAVAEEKFFMSYLEPEKYYIWDSQKKCDLVVGCIQHNSGGAYKAVKYAKKSGREVINIG
jgi:hypothetical protein